MPYVVTQTKTLITSFLTQASGFHDSDKTAT